MNNNKFIFLVLGIVCMVVAIGVVIAGIILQQGDIINDVCSSIVSGFFGVVGGIFITKSKNDKGDNNGSKRN